MEKLQEPFGPEDIEWRVQRSFYTGDVVKAIVCPYVTNRAIQNRLDSVIGPFNWKNEYSEWRTKGVLCGISIKFDNEWVTKFDAADETSYESTKGGISASSKRTASAWGIGRYLYKLEEVWVTVNQSKTNNSDQYFNAEVKKGNQKQWVKGYWTPPTLPNWALPKGYTNINSTGNDSQGQSNNKGNNENSKQKSKQGGNNRNQGNSGQGEPKPMSKDEMLRTIRNHEGNIGLPTDLRMRLFIKSNQGTNTSDISKATEAELQKYFWTLQPVSVVVSAAKNYGLSVEELLSYCQIVKPEAEIPSLQHLFFKLNEQDVQSIINMIRSEKSQQTA
ncbi:hypothetical protein CJ195_24265 [Bacillus sp. UMB0899]|nr:hypothetical protein CJ195_24265 [Bacillus sp. UMB0899]